MYEPTLTLLLSVASEEAAATGEPGIIYGLFNLLHQLLRWALLGLGVFALFRAFKGGTHTPAHRGANLAFMGSVHLNVVIGLVLWAAFSPMTETAFADFGGAMKNGVLRFYAVEHPFLMILAAVFATVGSVKSKKAETDEGKHKAVKIFFSLAMLALVLGIPWPFREAGRALFHLPF